MVVVREVISTEEEEGNCRFSLFALCKSVGGGIVVATHLAGAIIGVYSFYFLFFSLSPYGTKTDAFPGNPLHGRKQLSCNMCFERKSKELQVVANKEQFPDRGK